jgi:hypothetical protein
MSHAPPFPSAILRDRYMPLGVETCISCRPQRSLRADGPRRAARAAVLWALAAFILLQAGLELAIETWLPGLRDEFCYRKLKQVERHFAAAPPDATRIVVLGTSASFCNLHGEALERELHRAGGGKVAAYNFGIPGSSPLMELVTLKRLLAARVRPDIVFVEVLSPFLRGLPPLDPVRFTPERFALSELRMVRHYASYYSPVGYCDGRLVPWHSHRWGILRGVAPSFAVDDPWTHGIGAFDDHGAGHLDDQTRTPESFRRGIAQTEKSYGLYRRGACKDAPFGPILRELLETCRRENIQAVLVLMPECSAMRAWYDSTARTEMKSFIDELAREHGAAVVDAHDWIDDGGFLDGVHLVHSGAERFTAALAEQTARDLKPYLQTARTDRRRDR